MKYKEKYLAGYLARLFLRNPLTMILGITLITLGIVALSDGCLGSRSVLASGSRAPEKG
jgi:hypothetical protein